MCFLIFFNNAYIFLIYLDIRVWAVCFDMVIHIPIVFRFLNLESMVPDFNCFLNACTIRCPATALATFDFRKFCSFHNSR